MARYIDADALIRVLDAKAAMGTPKAVFFSVSRMVNYLPPADVAPRAEVVRKIFEEIEQYTKDVGFSSFAERFEFADFIAELKKKYTEAKTERPKGDGS